MLYIVATPIGNLKDITLRALEVLGSVDVIAAEDTRVTGKLLKHYEIKKPMVSYRARNSASAKNKVLELLEDGKEVALVTDAGTPGISDPGNELIAYIRETNPEVKIIPIPGASALGAALSVAGIDTHNFSFYGFLPQKKGRQTILKKIAEREEPALLYESPHRILKLLEEVNELMSERKLLIFRELTKMYESFYSGNASELLEYFNTHSDEVRGEFAVIING